MAPQFGGWGLVRVLLVLAYPVSLSNGFCALFPSNGSVQGKLTETAFHNLARTRPELTKSSSTLLHGANQEQTIDEETRKILSKDRVASPIRNSKSGATVFAINGDEGSRKSAVDVALSYEPTRFAPPSGILSNKHVQTIGGVLVRNYRFQLSSSRLARKIWPSLATEYEVQLLNGEKREFWDRRERIETEDGDFFDVDYRDCDRESSDSKLKGRRDLVVITHGLEASSKAALPKAIAMAFLSIGMDVACINFRSCSEEMNRTWGAYHLGFTDDLKLLLSRLSRCTSQTPEEGKRNIYLSGFSLGGNVILKLLGELGDEAWKHYGIKGAAVCAVPFDALKSSPKLNAAGFNRLIYANKFLKTLKKKALDQAEAFGPSAPFDINRVLAAETVQDFDDAVIAPTYGFKDAADYYKKTSCLNFFDGIQVPTIAINAKDDPFLDPESYPQESSSRPIRLVYPDHGGHGGFLFNRQDWQGVNPEKPRSWVANELARFVQHCRDSG